VRINYQVAIQESLDELRRHEHRLRGQKAAQRLRMLILLKSGQAKTLGQAAPFVGYSTSQVVRWWERYCVRGLVALEQEPQYRGMAPRLTAEARADVPAAMRRGEIATVEQARQYLHTQWGIDYHSINGIWWHFRHERTRKKTGRHRHVRSSAEQQDAFKKTLPIP
jgi:transposase